MDPYLFSLEHPDEEDPVLDQPVDKEPRLMRTLGATALAAAGIWAGIYWVVTK